MPTLAAASVNAVVCDPPYGLSFMGKGWDHGVPGVPFWEAALRVAKPGAMLLAFGGTRTHHRLMCAIEDAGWEIRDCLMWLYGSGFPKSMDISKAIDKAAGADHFALGPDPNWRQSAHTDSVYSGGMQRPTNITAPATDAAREWQGRGTALKPAWEPIIMAMKPLDGTFANNALVHGVAGINVDGCRIESEPIPTFRSSNAHRWIGDDVKVERTGGTTQQGRWPANVLLDEEAAQMLDEQSGTLTSGNPNGAKRNVSGPFLAHANGVDLSGYGDSGGASRFFYVAKASRRDRNEGLDGMPEQARNGEDYRRKINTSKRANDGLRSDMPRANHHPTVKPTQLMRYLCRMVGRPNSVILDPFMGSGSTGKAAALEGFRFIGIERDPAYFAIAQRRIEEAQLQLPLLEDMP